MDDQRNDIEKYLNGELSPKEMHELEKRALSDPFLADALEGAGAISSTQFSEDLSELRKRRGSGAGTVIPLWVRVARIAAGIAAVGVVAYLVFSSGSGTSVDRIAERKEPAINSAPKTTRPLSDSSVIRDDFQSSASDEASSANQAQDAASVGEAEQQIEERPAEIIEVPEKSERPVQPAPISDRAPAESPEESGVAGPPLAATSPAGAGVDRMKRSEQSVSKSKKVITGRVLDADDGRAIPGVNVVINGTELGTITNEDGRYRIAVDSLESGLLFTFIGYENKVVDIHANTVDVLLNPDAAQLSEVVVVGYGGTKREDPESDPILEMAAPVGGRKAYKNYLADSLRYPEQALNHKVEGRVTVQFTVDPAGRMMDFRVLKGLGYGCDEEVIRLIRQGPKWRPSRRNTEPVADKVRVRMKFRLPRN